MIEEATGQVLLERTYSGHYEQQMDKFKCDTPETKATMIGKSVKEAMNQLKIDLQKVLDPDREDIVSSVGIN